MAKTQDVPRCRRKDPRAILALAAARVDLERAREAQRTAAADAAIATATIVALGGLRRGEEAAMPWDGFDPQTLAALDASAPGAKGEPMGRVRWNPPESDGR